MRLNALVLIACLCGPLFAADSADKPIKDLIQRYDSAWLKKDVSAVEQVLAPEYIYFTSEGKIHDRKGTLEFLKKDSYKLNRSERSEIEIHRTGQTAIVSSRWIGTGTYDGKPVNDDQRCGIVLSQIKGEWLIIGEHCTQIAK